MHADQPIVLAPVPAAEQLEVQPLARVVLSFAGVREALAQPAYNHESGFPGDAEASRCVWRVRDSSTGALLVVWDEHSKAPTPSLTTDWLAWWRDGDGYPMSGQRMLDVLLGEDAGGQVLPLGN